MEPIFDAAWRAEALAGNAEAVTALAQQAILPLYRFCYHRVGQDQHLCEDVVQDTLLRAIDRLDRYDPDRCEGDIFPWLTGLGRNEIRRALARRSGSASLEALWARMDHELLRVYGLLAEQPFRDDLIRLEETRAMVNSTMSQIRPNYGRALEAKYVLGQTVREIAAALGQTEKAVESLLTRAREAFRNTFLALSQGLAAAHEDA